MIEVIDLSFSYNDRPFIDMNFSVKKGEIFGFLGPSGAGKSTLQKILTGLIRSYKGNAIVNKTECKSYKDDFYENIGVDFEFPSLYEKLTGRENLKFFGSLYSKKLRDVDELLKMVGLQNDGGKKVSEYSKGMKSRLNFIKALLHNPDILFLDEPTSGLDPNNSRIMKNIIINEKEKGKTIILTTHNMVDATELCDKVAFIVDGNIKALDSPHNLIMSKGAAKIKYTFMDGKEEIRECMLGKTSEDAKLQELIMSNRILSIHSSEPTLNDIFAEVTGSVLQ
ncbi:ABC transporter ATP-binding protein [Sedimentibacter hydroxybenzoicus DSM 7310]|uniref:ABC transporter ATP-binding protein n=1 Tax=Sedimentibacter hydroxybenzoicus DSM 7310 TaxID=1123245 RepID=A0A974BL26_SEDHY|nr:ABC transporter ATP-binding protein [Sedimentibacter hydroxybenzoicus]NYB75169.1 ABC transporter ATP-binding protein [Sedimentibacter hydroxybenzoicus DSM 7310]